MGLFDGTPLERPVTCERCGQGTDACACPASVNGRTAPPGDQRPRVRREKRRGRWSTVITGLDQSATDQKALLKRLRTALGTGGGLTTVTGPGAGTPSAETPGPNKQGPNKPGTETAIVLQGDHKAAAIAALIALGYRHTKGAGG